MDEIFLLRRILVDSGAYLTIGQGLAVTVEITLLSLAGGTVLGGLLCFLRRRKWRPLSLFAEAYIAVLQGSPVLMLLMLFYYGLFAGSDLSPLTVAVFTFSLHTAAYMAEILRSSLAALSQGENEAAGTLGFSALQAFRYVTFPQMIRQAGPVYRGTAINLLQWTSVVGYVTIMDLTRVIMGMGYQKFFLFSHLNVIDNLCLAPTKLLGLSREEAREKAQQLMAEMGLTAKAVCFPSQLSGGQQQRVAICRSLMMEKRTVCACRLKSAKNSAAFDKERMAKTE